MIKNKKKYKVTISLVTWNGEKYLPWLVNSLKDQTFNDWQLLVLDNASTDRSVEIIENSFPEASLIKQKKNIGFAKAHNLIINWSDSDYVLVLNQDVILEPDYLAKLVHFLGKHPHVASVAGKLMYWDFAEGRKTDIIDSFGLKINRQRKVCDWASGEKDFVLDNQEVFGLSGALALFRRKALAMVAQQLPDGHWEYFDEDFFAYKEDIDLAWRLRCAGWQNWLLTDAYAWHHRTVSVGGARKNRGLANKLSYRNHLLTLYKNSFFKDVLHDFWQIFFYESGKFLYLLLFERSSLLGLREFWRLWSKFRKKRKFIFKYRQVESADINRWFK